MKRSCLEQVLVLAALAGCVAMASIAAAGDPAPPIVLEDVAGRMADRCFAYAGENALPAMSVAIVDAAGTLVHFQRQRGSSGAAAEAAMLKAQTSARTRYPTSALASEEAAARDLYLLLKLTQIAGGVPILISDEFMGAVGVSGALPEADATCALQAVAAATPPDNA